MKFIWLLLFTIILVNGQSSTATFLNDEFQVDQIKNSSINISDKSDQLLFGDGTMLQSFYWLTPDHGDWWSMLEKKIPEFADVGFDSIWAPPMVKTREGDIPSGGYEPYDFYDLGEFDQQGRIRTRYGTRTQLENFIAVANLNNIAVTADVVINHNQGGEMEFNPIIQDFTPTDFSDVASGKFPRDYTAFHPCVEEAADNYQFANFPDLCHANQYVHDELIEWGKWLRDVIGFDGWRFDVAIGINSTMLKDWFDVLGGGSTGIAEYWGGTFDDMTNYLDQAGSPYGFDFYLMYALRWMVLNDGSYDLRNLQREGLLNTGRKNQAATFVVNHDTVRQQNVNIPKDRHLAYSYILTHEGYPTVFWGDYFDENLQPHLIPLIKGRVNYAKGPTNILYADSDLYIMERSGNPGLIYALNDNPSTNKEATVKTKWQDTTLYEQTDKVSDISIGSDGTTTISVPPRSYVVFTEDETGSPVSTLLNREEFIPQSTIDFAEIEIDGLFDSKWGYPQMIDIMGDAHSNQQDLENAYVKYDAENLYVSFTYNQDIVNDQPTHYAIALDFASGGSFEDPLHENIKFSLGGSPDHIYYLKTDPDDLWNDIASTERFEYNSDTEAWNSGSSVASNMYISDAVMGFTEIQIPLDTLGLSGTSEIGIKLYSSADGVTTAIDSLPHDDTIEASDGNSWLAFGDKFEIKLDEIPISSESDSGSSSKKDEAPINFTGGLIILPIVIRRLKSMKK